MILALTADGTVPDVPPGHEVCALDHEWYVRFGTDSWDDEFVADSREEARAECWRRFCADEPEWSELLVRLLGTDPVLRAARTIVSRVAPERTPRQVLLDTLETNRRDVALWPASLRNAISFNGLFDLPPDET